MTLSAGLTTAVSGLQTSALQARTAAYNIANVSTQDFAAKAVQQSSVVTNGQGAGVSAAVSDRGTPDLASNLVSLNRASVTYAANATVVRTLEEISGETLDILA